MQIMLISIPMGPLLILEDGLKPRIGSTLFARFSYISETGFMKIPYGDYFMEYSK
jgi:hypothetical protein